MIRLVDRFLKYLVLAIYSVISILLFNKVYETSSEVIDELFHLDQGLRYCQGNFSDVSWQRLFTFAGRRSMKEFSVFFQWNPKITTFPGLYLLSSVIPSDMCDIYTLRLVPLVSSVVNVLLIYEIKSLMLYASNKGNNNDALLETMALSILPPMYFFAHVYYTDVPSITMILLMLLFSLQKHHKLSAIFGAASVVMRQTNIVWVGGTLGVHLVDKMMFKVYPKMRRENAKFSNFLFALKSHLKHPKVLAEFVGGSLREFFGYFLVIVSFIGFLIHNGSIVGKSKTCSSLKTFLKI